MAKATTFTRAPLNTIKSADALAASLHASTGFYHYSDYNDLENHEGAFSTPFRSKAAYWNHLTRQLHASRDAR